MIRKAEIKVKNLSLAGSTSVGMRAGPFVFFGSQTPMDLDTGKLVSDFFEDLPEEARRQFTSGMVTQDVREGRILTQAWRIYHNLQSILAEQGSSLDNVVNQRIFLKDMWDVASLEKVILAFMPKERPATTIVGAANPRANQELDIQADFVAIAGDAGVRRENISTPALDRLTTPYPLATKAGQFMFFTPLAGVDPETGRLVNRIDELSPEDRDLAPSADNAWHEARIAQYLTIMRHVRRILESQGAPLLGSLVHHQGWWNFPKRQTGQLNKVRQRLFAADPKTHTTMTGVRVSGLRREDALFEYGMTALIPPKGPDDYRTEISLAPTGLSHWSAPALKAGPFVFACEISQDPNAPHRFINKFSDLRDEARFLPYGRCHAEKPIMAQAWNTYRLLKSYLEHFGSSMENVVHQSLYMLNPDDYPALERIATMFYGSKLPPTTVVPYLGSSGFPECELEILLVAVVPEIGRVG